VITINPRVSRRAARLTTNILAPANLVIAGLPLVGLAANPPLAGFLWGCLAALFAGVIPLTVILHGVRRGQLSDIHIIDREQRHTPLLISILSVALGLALLYVLPAAGEVRALTVAMLAGLITTAAVTRIWKSAFTPPSLPASRSSSERPSGSSAGSRSSPPPPSAGLAFDSVITHSARSSAAPSSRQPSRRPSTRLSWAGSARTKVMNTHHSNAC